MGAFNRGRFGRGAFGIGEEDYVAELTAISRTPSVLLVLTMDSCQRTFGTSPCLATGTPCYNTWSTCTYRSAYLAGPKDYTFGLRESPAPLPGVIVRPYIEEMRYLAQEILPNEALTLNQTFTLVMADERDNDVGVDPYRTSPTQRSAPGGSVGNTAMGTFWTKFLTRNRNYKNRRATIKKGFVTPGFGLGDYQTDFIGVLDNIALDAGGRAKLTVKGLLQLTDTDHPKKTDGRLNAELAVDGASLILSAWSGVDRSVYPPVTQYTATGLLKIESELLSYTGRSLDATTGLTTVTGLARGLHNPDGWGAAAVHAVDAGVQQVVVYEGNPIDLMHSLLNVAGIADADIAVSVFAAQRDTWFPGVIFRGILHQPAKIKTYLNELREQTATSLWQADTQQITLAVIAPLAPGQTYTRIQDAEHAVAKSSEVDDHEERRITRRSIYYDIFAGKGGSGADDFARDALGIDSVAESPTESGEIRWGSPIYSRWIRSSLGGDAYARTLASRTITRFRDGGRAIRFDLELKDEALAMGQIFERVTADVVDFDGQPAVARYQVVRRDRRSHGRIAYTATDTKLQGRYAWVAAAGAPDYDAASAAQREYCFVADANGNMPNGDEPYLIS
jgi:hypothetical protein